MVNRYNLEWELIKKSQVTDRAPQSSEVKGHIYDYSDCECGCKKFDK
jgi:hypothetical protein